MITIAAFKNSITPKLHGATLAKISDVYGKCREASQNMLLRVDPEALIRRYQIQAAIYDKVYNYPVASDLGTDAVIDIRPVGPRRRHDDIEETFDKDFDIKKKNNTFTLETINGVRTLRLSKRLKRPIVLSTLDTTDDANAAIAVLGDASNLRTDYLNHVSGQASVAIDLSGATGSGGISITLPVAIDLSELLRQGSLFEWIRFPDVTRLTSVTLKWGDNASNYWSSTQTAAYDRSFVSGAFQLLENPWQYASVAGSPTTTGANIRYLEVDFTYLTGAAITDVNIDNITAQLGEVWEVLYYSNCLFTDSTGTVWKDTPTDDTDLIRLDTDGLQIFMYEFMLTLQQEIKGKNMSADYTYFQGQLFGKFGQRGIQTVKGLYELYSDRYPSQRLNRDQEYYEFDELDGY